MSFEVSTTNIHKHRLRRNVVRAVKALVVPLLILCAATYAYRVLSSPDIWLNGAPPPAFPNRMVHTLLMFFGELPQSENLRTENGRLLLALGSAVLVTIGSLIQLISSWMTRLQDRLAFQLYLRDHIVICGLSRKGEYLARDHALRGDRVLVIELHGQHGNLERVRDYGVHLQIGDARDSAILKAGRIHRARRVFCLCDDDTNIEIFNSLRRCAQKMSIEMPDCVIHINECDRFNALQYHEFTSRRSLKKLKFMNVSVWETQQLLTWSPKEAGDTFPMFPTEESPRRIVIVGATDSGKLLAAEAARRWQLMRPSGNTERLRILMLGENATTVKDDLERLHPALVHSWELEAGDLSARSGFSQLDELIVYNGGTAPSRVFVCLETDSESMIAGLEFVRILRKRGSDPNSSDKNWERTLIVARVRENEGALWFDALQNNEDTWTRLLQPFRVLETVMRAQWNGFIPIDQVAIALHDVYCAEERRKREDARKSGEDYPLSEAVVPWDILSEEFKEANRAQAASIKEALSGLDPPRQIVFPPADEAPLTDAEIEALSQREHDRWIRHRMAEGWSFGKERDDYQKLHPMLIPWEDLDEDNRNKDRILVASWPEILRTAGLLIAK